MSTKTSDRGRPTVFLSYSHKDEVWKDRVEVALKVLELQDDLEVWDDRRIAAGDDWLPEIEEAMNHAAVAVLLVSNDFLASRFIRGTEVPHLLKRRQEEGLQVIPLFVRPSPWQAVSWLAAIQGRPRDAKALSKLRKAQADEILADLALEIQELLTPWPPLPSPSPRPGEGERESGGIKKTDQGASPLSRGTGVRWERGKGGEELPRLDLGRLPIAGPLLIGRETELARLDAAWEAPSTHVLTFVAFGGVGKSALVAHWLDRMAAEDWRGARRVLDWSFYSQGTEERVASADRFLDHALAWFGDPDFKGAPRDRGLRLAELVRQEKTLLVLDGVEPLQHPPNSPLAGRLKDPGLAALLKSLAGGNPGLCVVTTRERIADLESFPKAAPQEDLEALSPEAGAELLKRLGVKGKDSELLASSREFGNHALTLSLLGGYLNRACGGDVRRRKEVNLAGADQRKGGHALRVIGKYAEWLGEGPELTALRLLGLFDRPAGPKALAVLRAKPVVPGLTEPLIDLSEEGWQLALSILREYGLILPADPHQPGTLDAHPLVRVFFQEELEKQRPEAWRAGNLRLYEHLQGEAPDLPNTLEAMEPLYTAVVHGCRAGRQQEALDEVYYRRILRRDKQFSWKKLGSFGSDLSALSGLFDRTWDQPSRRINAQGKGFILHQAGLYLSALGRLAEAVQPLEAALREALGHADWENASASASGLSELSLTLGEVERAVTFGKQGVNLSDQIDGFARIATRMTLANALHQAGNWGQSAAAFRRAEALQVELQPEYPLLYSVGGYTYCALLLSRGEPDDGSVLDRLGEHQKAARRFLEACREVRKRAEQTLELVGSQYSLLDTALDHLSLGRAHLGLGLTAPRPPDKEAEANFAKAAEHVEHAVESLRRAGTEDHLPRGLLAQAALRRLWGDLPAAEADLAEALEIAERGSMRLHECDAHLEWARLCRQRGYRDGLERHVAQARRLVKETGYGRRAREVAWLERQLDSPGLT